ncbi:hypothetical protein Pmani_013826 [Petrolisthes manimaculis]|uniref:Uncharacterized protein n=1 Tax=Petrolisthes manimaculis TaxID=1843537 RepID=A0AAE1U992_9EUCA|nr:hypothetical protein Pmani_013826 [Petrolisthes manimaculis]
MPGFRDPVILPRPDLTLHRAPPRPAPPRPAPPRIHSPLRKVCEGRTPTSSFVGAYCTVPRPPSAYQGNAHTPPVMSARNHTSSRASDFRYSATWCRDSRHTSTRSWESRRHSLRSQYSRHNSIRSRSSFRDSIRSVASSAWQETARRGEPLRRVASPHVRSAQEWAGRVKERVSGGGGAPLLTPGRHRRSPEVVERQGDASPGSARNSHRVHPTVWATSAAHTLRWETSSGLAALVECGAAAGSAAVAGAERLCATATAMADAKFQQLRRSISNWSLSTVKKPKVSLPKLKKPKLKFLSGGKKNRVDPKDESVALDEVKAALLKAEGNETVTSSGGEVIHNPSTSRDGGDDTQPTIVLTVHHRNTPPDPPPPPPSPGLLAANNDLDFIDSDDPETDERVAEAISPEVDYSDQWFDARGTLTRSKNNLVEAVNDYDYSRLTRYYDARGTQYYDVTDEGELETNTYDPITVNNTEEKGSVRAREWVKSFDEEAESRVERWMKMQKNRNPSSLPKSKSEIRLDEVEDAAETEKWSNRDEIKLNMVGKNGSTNSSKDHDKKLKIQEMKKQQDEEKEKLARKQSLKKIFQVRGKLSIKPIVDSLRNKYTDTDIYIASTPIALANTSTDLRPSDITDSLDVSDDGINCSSVDFDPGVDIRPDQDEVQYENQSILTTKSPETQKGLKVDPKLQDDQHQISNGADVMTDSATEAKRKRNVPEQVKLEATVSSAKSENLQNTMDNSGKCKSVSHDKAPPVLEHELTDQNDKQKPTTQSEILLQETNGMETFESISLENEEQVTGPSLQLTPDTKTETTKLSVENQSSLAQKIDIESHPDPSKLETKKKKIPGANIQKSIKNFAGSIFSQQTIGKGKKEGGEDKKKRSRISPFTKEHIFKSSSKPKVEGKTAETKNTEGEIRESSNNKGGLTVMGVDEKEIVTDVATDVPDADTRSDSKCLNGTSNEVSNDVIPESLPDVLSSAGSSNINTSMRVSPERLALIPTECDEQKSISHESSPGMDTSFVEEDGLRLRKDALQAIKAMENDETATHFYSFLSASEYHTPVTKVPQNSDSHTEPVSQQLAKSTPVEESKKPTGEPESIKKSEKEKTEMDKEPQISMAPVDTQTVLPMSNQSKQPENELHYDISSTNHRSATENLQTNSTDASAEPTAKSEYHITSPPMTATVTTSPDSSQSNAVPPEVPKLKLTPALPVEGEQPPKPSPRLKKGRYGYSANGTKKAPTNPPASVSGLTKPENSTAKVENVAINGNVSSKNTFDNNEIATFPRRTHSKKRAPLVEHERISSDSGYVGPHSTSYYYGGNENANSDTEPIYWEISETKDAPPRPSPRRTKKGQQTPSDSSLEQTPPYNGDTPSSLSSQSETKEVPEWINKRAPIPSPRSRKQRSLQSLPTVVPPDDSLETIKRNLQFQSEAYPDDATIQLKERIQAATEDQFYSGKAASISYGFTPHSQVTSSRTTVPPSPPLRGRKASQMSLPGAMMAEEKKINRRSIHEDNPALNTRSNLSHRPKYTNRARRRTDPTQGISIRAIKSAMQRVGETVTGLTDLLVSVGLQHEASPRKSE